MSSIAACSKLLSPSIYTIKVQSARLAALRGKFLVRDSIELIISLSLDVSRFDLLIFWKLLPSSTSANCEKDCSAPKPKTAAPKLPKTTSQPKTHVNVLCFETLSIYNLFQKWVKNFCLNRSSIPIIKKKEPVSDKRER